MTITHGADVEALLTLAEHLSLQAELVLVVGDAVQAELDALRWTGPDAERTRREWAALNAARIRTTATALLTAAEQVVTQAEEQGAASAAGAGASAPGTSGVGSTDTLRERLGLLRDVALEAPEVATMATAARTWENGMSVYPHASAVLSEGSGLTRWGGRFLTGAGAAIDGVDVYQGVRDGDAHQAVGGGVGLAITGAGLAGWGAAGPAGVAWTGGTFVGDAARAGMQDTRYGEIVEEMSAGAFRENGVLGVAQVPGILGFAAWERVREAVADDD